MPYEQVDPKAARELFIRHALVLMEYDSRAPFFAHNLKLLEDTEYLQQKGRRVDLLGDEQQLYAFFDARVPEGISTGAAFERWRREAEAKDPKLLWLTEQRHRARRRRARRRAFPDHLSAGPLVMQLRYRFEPGHEDDGVSALIPLHVLNQLPEEPFEWLVPGLFDEKVEALVRSLPKNLRVHFVPVPEAVARALPLLERGCGSLHAQLADALLRTGGVPVPRDAFREDLLPPHLRMNFVLLDDADKVIARSRSLAALREKHAGASQQDYAKQSELTTGARTWVFGDLPERQDAAPGSRKQVGLSGAGRRGRQRRACACSRRRPRRASATSAAARGSIRLVMARDLKPLRRDLAVNVQGEMVYKVARRASAAESGSRRRPRPARRPARSHRDDGVPRGPRAAAQCRGLRRAHRRRSAAASDCRRRRSRAPCRPRWSGWGESRRRCPRLRRAAAADIRAQLAWLAPAGFLLTTPWERLKEFPRYLQAHRAAAREAGPRSAARRAARGRDRAARGALPRARQGRARPAAAGRRRVPLAAGGIPRVVVRAAAQDARPGFGAASGGRVGRTGAHAAGLTGAARVMLRP